MGTTFNKVPLKRGKKKKLTEFVFAIKQYIKCKPDTEESIPRSVFLKKKILRRNLVFLLSTEISVISSSIPVSYKKCQVFLSLAQFLPAVVTRCHFRA